MTLSLLPSSVCAAHFANAMYVPFKSIWNKYCRPCHSFFYSSFTRCANVSKGRNATETWLRRLRDMKVR